MPSTRPAQLSKRVSSLAAALHFFAARPSLDKLKISRVKRRSVWMIVRRAIEAPLRQIAENAGVDGAVDQSWTESVSGRRAPLAYNALSQG